MPLRRSLFRIGKGVGFRPTPLSSGDALLSKMPDIRRYALDHQRSAFLPRTTMPRVAMSLSATLLTGCRRREGRG
jgi:hypothetical protein